MGLDLGDDLRTANNSLISTLGDVGFEVVGGIENIREAIDVSDISSAFRRIPEEVEAAAEPEPEPEAEPEVLAGVHRFSGAESRRLGILRTNVDAAEDAVRLLDENSTEAEITAAYTDLADAERDLYATQIGFIQSATGITEEAREDAFTLAEGVFGRELFDANQKLVRALGDVGLQLVAMFDATTGILRGTALATQQIPVEAEEAADETEDAADETDPVAILRSNARLAANQVRRSRTGLGQATSESDFETRRLGLTQSVNAAFATQILLLDALGLSEADYQDRFEDAEDTRDAALTRATSSVNTFAEARIKGEEDAAEAAIDAAERAERERMRIAERHQRAIDDLREDAIDAEQDRADRLVDLEQDTQDRILDIIRDANRSKEDIAQDFLDDNEDLRRAFNEDQTEVADALSRGEIDRAEADRRVGELSRSFIEEGVGLQRERDRDLRGVGVREGRRVSDVQRTSADREQEIIRESEAQALAIRDALAPLLEGDSALSTQQQQTATTESETAIVTAETAATTAGTAIMAAGTAETESMIAESNAVNAETFSTAALSLTEAGVELQDAARVQGLQDAALAIGSAAERFEEVILQIPELFAQITAQITATEFGVTQNLLEQGFFDPTLLQPPATEIPSFSDALAMVAPGVPIQTLDGAVGGGAINVRVTNIAELSSALAAGGTNEAPQVVLNVDNSLVLDDGSISKVEGRMAVRSDQGLSPLNV